MTETERAGFSPRAPMPTRRTAPPAAAQHRNDGDVEPAPRRRVMAHQREDEFMDDVPSADREESPRGNVRVLRRRADRMTISSERPGGA